MREERYFYVPDAESHSELPADEAVHAVRVLRLKEGDPMVLMDGAGNFYKALVTLAAGHRCTYRIVEHCPQPRPWRGFIHLAIAPTKLMDRMEWLAEKATEIGFDRLELLNCTFSERKVVKTPRLEAIVVAAMKQSRKAWRPEVSEMSPFKKVVDDATETHRYIAHCYPEIERVNLFSALGETSADDSLLVMVGPEGDFSIDEVRYAIEKGFVSVDLGSQRLRTETAGLAAVMMMQISKTLDR